MIAGMFDNWTSTTEAGDSLDAMLIAADRGHALRLTLNHAQSRRIYDCCVPESVLWERARFRTTTPTALIEKMRRLIPRVAMAGIGSATVIWEDDSEFADRFTLDFSIPVSVGATDRARHSEVVRDRVLLHAANEKIRILERRLTALEGIITKYVPAEIEADYTSNSCIAQAGIAQTGIVLLNPL
jgi:hypothetical protein